MHKNQLIYNCSRPLVNVCNPVLDRKVGVTVWPVHANQGKKSMACEVTVEIPTLNTESSVKILELDKLDVEVKLSLLNGVTKLDKMIEELQAHRDHLFEQANLVGNQIEVSTTAEKQRDLHWSDHDYVTDTSKANA